MTRKHSRIFNPVQLLHMFETSLKYGILTILAVIPTFILVVRLRKRKEEASMATPGTVRTESTAGRIGAAILIMLIGITILVGTFSFAKDLSHLAETGEETAITIQSLDKNVLNHGRKKAPDTYDQYYTVTYVHGGEVKETTFKYSSRSKKETLEIGSTLPAVFDNLENPHRIEAPSNKKLLQGTVMLMRGGGILLAGLFAAGAIRIVTRKPYQLKKSADGKTKWEM